MNLKPRLALFQPDIPQNTGAMLRLAACLDVAVDVIGPTGFVFGERRMKRAGMDYVDQVDLQHHVNWNDFLAARAGGRLILMTIKGRDPYTDFAFQAGDVILMGAESSGAPDFVHDVAAARLVIPLASGMRSLNVAQAAAMVLGEALRQIGEAAAGPAAGPAVMGLETTP